MYIQNEIKSYVKSYVRDVFTIIFFFQEIKFLILDKLIYQQC